MSQKLIYFQIVTPERVVLKEEIRQVSVPTALGEITVLPNHIPLVSTLVPGVIEIVGPDNKREIISVSGGFIEVLKDKVVILADAAERAEEIDIEQVEAAKQRAAEEIKNIRREDEEKFVDVSAQLAIALAKTTAVKRWRKLKGLEK